MGKEFKDVINITSMDNYTLFVPAIMQYTTKLTV